MKFNQLLVIVKQHNKTCVLPKISVAAITTNKYKPFPSITEKTAV